MKKFIAYLSLLIPQSWLTSRYIVERMMLLSDDPSECEHEWDVVASILSTVELQVQCKKCSIYSEVPDPTEEEWEQAFDAMEKPYLWSDHSRIRYYMVGETLH